MEEERKKFFEEINPFIEEYMKIERFRKTTNQVDNQAVERRQEEIYYKVRQSIKIKQETIAKELAKKEEKFYEVKKRRSTAITAKIKAYKIRRAIIDSEGTDTKRYKAADEETKKAIQTYKAAAKEYTSITKELEQAKQQFDEYKDIDSDSKDCIYQLLAMVGRYEEQESVRMSDGQVYDNGKPIIDMGTIMGMQEEAKQNVDYDNIVREYHDKVREDNEEITKMENALVPVDNSIWGRIKKLTNRFQEKLMGNYLVKFAQKTGQMAENLLNFQKNKQKQQENYNEKHRKKQSERMFNMDTLDKVAQEVIRTNEMSNTFIDDLKKDVPTQEKQRDNIRKFNKRREKNGKIVHMNVYEEKEEAVN